MHKAEDELRNKQWGPANASRKRNIATEIVVGSGESGTFSITSNECSVTADLRWFFPFRFIIIVIVP